MPSQEPEDLVAMTPHRKIFTSLCIASTLALAAAPALAEDDEDQDRNAQEEAMALAQEGAQKLVQAIELMLKAIPQYGAPEILDNGDIVIRRLNPDDGGTKDNGTSSETEEGEDVEETDI
jgi:hypothetical protein